MTWRQRLRVVFASLTRDWSSFTCACGADVWVSDSAGQLLQGQQCDACHAKTFDIWQKDFTARHEHIKGVEA